MYAERRVAHVFSAQQVLTTIDGRVEPPRSTNSHHLSVAAVASNRLINRLIQLQQRLSVHWRRLVRRRRPWLRVRSVPRRRLPHGLRLRRLRRATPVAAAGTVRASALATSVSATVLPGRSRLQRPAHVAAGQLVVRRARRRLRAVDREDAEYAAVHRLVRSVRRALRRRRVQLLRAHVRRVRRVAGARRGRRGGGRVFRAARRVRLPRHNRAHGHRTRVRLVGLRRRLHRRRLPARRSGRPQLLPDARALPVAPDGRVQLRRLVRRVRRGARLHVRRLGTLPRAVLHDDRRRLRAVRRRPRLVRAHVGRVAQLHRTAPPHMDGAPPLPPLGPRARFASRAREPLPAAPHSRSRSWPCLWPCRLMCGRAHYPRQRCTRGGSGSCGYDDENCGAGTDFTDCAGALSEWQDSSSTPPTTGDLIGTAAGGPSATQCAGRVCLTTCAVDVAGLCQVVMPLPVSHLGHFYYRLLTPVCAPLLAPGRRPPRGLGQLPVRHRLRRLRAARRGGAVDVDSLRRLGCRRRSERRCDLLVGTPRRDCRPWTRP